jgi:hypothetical protein
MDDDDDDDDVGELRVGQRHERRSRNEATSDGRR